MIPECQTPYAADLGHVAQPFDWPVLQRVPAPWWRQLHDQTIDVGRRQCRLAFERTDLPVDADHRLRLRDDIDRRRTPRRGDAKRVHERGVFGGCEWH